MGSMSSPAKSVENLHFKKMPKRPTPGTFVQVDGVQVLKGEKGALYTNVEGLNKSYFMAGAWRWSDAMTECLDLLGLLTSEDKERHQKWIAELQRQESVVSALGDAKRMGEKTVVMGISIKVDNKKLVEMWDSLPPHKQREAYGYGYMPKGAAMKPAPARV